MVWAGECCASPEPDRRHRRWLRRRWTHRSTPTRPGRPRAVAAIRSLVDQMGAANPLWGAPRIHGELGKLGIEVSERTVSRLLRRSSPTVTDLANVPDESRG